MAFEFSPLVIAKTRLPPRRAEILRRPRLLDHLYAQIEKQLFLITAPAGYGKTSLLLDFAHEADFPVAWYTLDEFDNAPLTFLAYLIESVRVHFPGFGVQAMAALEHASDATESLQSVSAMIANAMFSLPDHLTIVLDDYHVIRNPLIDRLVHLLIRYAGDSCHLLIDSRTIPHLPDQVLLLARGQMDGISLNELRFTVPEIQTLVQQNYGLTVSEQRAQELARISDGWITALLLMGHQAGWRRLVEGALEIPEVAGKVFDYLAEQIFSRQPAEIQRFLLGSSVMDPMPPDLLDALPGVSDSRQHLATLEDQQLFLNRLGGVEEVYSYHPLFREFLRTRLRHEHPEWYAEISSAYAAICGQQGQWDRAVEVYASLGRPEDVVHALESAEESLRTPFQIGKMTYWVEALPQTDSPLSPHLQSLKGKIHMARGEQAQALIYFDRSAAMFESAGDYAAAADKLRWKCDVLRFLGRYQESISESERMDKLLETLPPEEQVPLRAASLHVRGTSKYYLGEFSAALADLELARELLLKTEYLLGLANVHHDLGITYRALGRLSEAMEYYSAALGWWDRLKSPAGTANTLNSLGYVYLLRGETREAERILHDALVRAREAGALRNEGATLATLGDLYRDQADYPKALEYYNDSLRAAQRSHYASMIFYSKLATGDTYRLMGDLARAREWLDSAAENAIASASLVDSGQLKLAQGLLANDQSQLAVAASLIGDAALQFSQAGNKHFEALAEYNLAHVLNLLGRTQESTPHLIRTAELIKTLGYDHFLVVEGRRTFLTLRFASGLPEVGDLFKRILPRVGSSPHFAVPSTSSIQAAPALAVYSLGREDFTVNGNPVSNLRPQVRELFLFLLTRFPLGARKEELAELLWRDLSAERADGALRITITRIRKALCPVSFSNGWYALAPEHLWHDVQEFERGLADAKRATDAPARISRLRQALELYRGDYSARVEADWVLTERQRLRNAYLTALLSLAEAYTQVDDLNSALSTFEKATIVEPFMEAAWEGLMQTYLRQGNRAAAKSSYAKLKQILQKEMGIEPSPEIQTLYQRLIKMQV